MTSKETILKQRQRDLRVIENFLNKIPLSYMDNMRFHSIIMKYPLETLLLGRKISHSDYKDRLKKWVKESIEKSPYLNN